MSLESQKFAFLSEVAAYLEAHTQPGYYELPEVSSDVQIDIRALIQFRDYEEWRRLERQMFSYGIDLLILNFRVYPPMQKPSNKQGFLEELEQNNQRIRRSVYALNILARNHCRVVEKLVVEQNHTISRLNEFLEKPLTKVSMPEFSEFPVPDLPKYEE